MAAGDSLSLVLGRAGTSLKQWRLWPAGGYKCLSLERIKLQWLVDDFDDM